MTEPIVLESITPNIALPLLFAGQAQKEATLNEALIRLDHLSHRIVEGEAATPPAVHDAGQAWIVSAGAGGSWAGHDASIAFYAAENWHFLTPSVGMVVFDRAARQLRRFDAQWQQSAAISDPSGGQVVDIEARTAIGDICQLLREAGLLA